MNDVNLTDILQTKVLGWNPKLGSGGAIFTYLVKFNKLVKLNFPTIVHNIIIHCHDRTYLFRYI